MTVATETARNDYIGTGLLDTYDYTFAIYNETDLRVTVRDTDNVETELAYPADFSVTGVGDEEGGTITLTAGSLTDDYALAIRFRTTLTQETDLRNQGAYLPEVVEDTVDRLLKIDQQQQDEIDRSLKFGDTYSDISAIIENAADGYYLRIATVDGQRVVQAVSAVNDSGSYLAPFTGAVSRSVTSRLGRFMLLSDFGTFGVGNDSDLLDDAIAAMANPSTLVFDVPTLYLKRAPVVGTGSTAGTGKHFHFDNCQIIVDDATDDIALFHVAESRVRFTGVVRFNGNGRSNCWGLLVGPHYVTPELDAVSIAAAEAALSATVQQNSCQLLAEMTFDGGLAIGLATAVGPKIGAEYSGCHQNVFGHVFATSLTTGIKSVDMSAVVAGDRSGANSNKFLRGVDVNGSFTTAIHLTAGGGWRVREPHMENGTNGIIVQAAMANGDANPDNSFYSPHTELVTTPYSIGNADTHFYNVEDAEVFIAEGAITPYLDRYHPILASMGSLISNIYDIVSVANLKGLWLFNEFGVGTAIPDVSGNAHNLTLRNAALATQAANEWGPRIQGNALALTYGDESHLWDTASHADFQFGDGATDVAFSVVALIYPTLASACEVISKDDVTTGSTKREWSLSLRTDGTVDVSLFDNSVPASIGRTTPVSAVEANTLHVVGFTYSGSSASSGVKIYVDGVQVDNANLGSGAYTAMEALAAKVASYRIAAGGTPERPYKGRLFAQLIVEQELTAAQMRQLSFLLRPYAGASLFP